MKDPAPKFEDQPKIRASIKAGSIVQLKEAAEPSRRGVMLDTHAGIFTACDFEGQPHV